VPTDRELRDELERLQVEARKLTAELEASPVGDLTAALAAKEREYVSAGAELDKLAREINTVDARTDALLEQLIRWLDPDRP
jgi:hypothetical protein